MVLQRPKILFVWKGNSYFKLEKLSHTYLCVNTNEELNQENFNKNYYNVKIVFSLMLKSLQEGLYEKFVMLISLLDGNEDISCHSDYIFLRYAFLLTQIQNQFSSLSKEFLTSYSVAGADDPIFPQEYLDSLLGTFLFMDGYYEESYQVFKQLLSSNKIFPFFLDKQFIKSMLRKE